MITLAVSSGKNTAMLRLLTIFFITFISLSAQSQLIPPYAISSGNLSAYSGWACQHDPGTGSGDSSAVMTYPYILGGYSDVRKFDVTYNNYGGELCYVRGWAKDTVSQNFIYDVWVQIGTPSLVGNLEMDMNQVLSNGKTVIMAFQCSMWSGDKWDYTYVANNATHWAPTALACNPETWGNTWHHIQFYMSRDDNGNVTYHWVAFDGVKNDIGITVPEELSLGWSVGAMVVNFQMDPSESNGEDMIVYNRLLTIYRWASPEPPSDVNALVGN